MAMSSNRKSHAKESLSSKGDNWMEDAVKRPGALKAKARGAGQGTMEFARSHDTGNSRTAKQSRLAETFSKFRKK